jgi:SAM-dependent methyltransferase
VRLAEQLHETGARDRRIRVLAGHLARLLPEGLSVLDVGSGDGRLARLLMSRRADLAVRGADVLVRPGTAIPVEPFDGRRLPFGDGAFGAAMLVDALHHSEDPAALLAEAARVAPLLVIKDHLADAPLAVPRLRFMDRVGNARFGVRLTYHYWTRARWNEAFVSLGLTTEVWMGRLHLYPAPLSWVFDGSLHFLARLRR